MVSYFASDLLLFYFLKDFIHLFLDRGEGREEEGEKHQYVVASHAPSIGDLAFNPGMRPDPDLTGDLLVHRPMLNLQSHTSQGNK